MGSANIAAAGNASPPSDKFVTRKGQGCHLFASVMRRARSWWKNDTISTLAEILDCHERTARRHLMGENVPDAEAAFRLIISDKGPAAIEALMAHVPPNRQKRFIKDIQDAAKRADIRRRQRELDREMQEAGM